MKAWQVLCWMVISLGVGLTLGSIRRTYGPQNCMVSIPPAEVDHAAAGLAFTYGGKEHLK